MFQNVIVKQPCHRIAEGITSSPELGKPDYEKALEQHCAYVKALEKTGAKVCVLEANDAFPDSCFVEDTAVLTSKCAIVTNPGADSRKDETAAIVPVLQHFFPKEVIEFIHAPGTLEGGDVMMVRNHFYVGKSSRTNAEGIRQFLDILKKYGLSGSEVPLEHVLHLKTGVNYIENRNILVSGEFKNNSQFESYQKIEIPEEEAYAANSIWMNGTVIVPQGYPQTEQLIRDAGYPVITVDASEFRKIDGGLSCLFLRFTSLL